jgi:hypothetical protein
VSEVWVCERENVKVGESVSVSEYGCVWVCMSVSQ